MIEPDNLTVLYWRGDEYTFPTLVLRDDDLAAGLGMPEHRWFEPNADEEAQTWLEVLVAVDRRRLDLADAVRFSAPTGGADEAELKP